MKVCLHFEQLIGKVNQLIGKLKQNVRKNIKTRYRLVFVLTTGTHSCVEKKTLAKKKTKWPRCLTVLAGAYMVAKPHSTLTSVKLVSVSSAVFFRKLFFSKGLF